VIQVANRRVGRLLSHPRALHHSLLPSHPVSQLYNQLANQHCVLQYNRHPHHRHSQLDDRLCNHLPNPASPHPPSLVCNRQTNHHEVQVHNHRAFLPVPQP
jgi:hypothetical protein